MLRVTKLTDYAIVVLTHLARQEGEACLTARDLADCSDVPAPTVSKLLKALAKGGLVASQRGAKGGYRLLRPPEDISVAEVIGAIEGPIAMTECSHDDSGLCEVEDNCNVRTNWQRINVAVQSALSAVSIADMMGASAPRSDLVQLGIRTPGATGG